MSVHNRFIHRQRQSEIISGDDDSLQGRTQRSRISCPASDRWKPHHAAILKPSARMAGSRAGSAPATSNRENSGRNG